MKKFLGNMMFLALLVGFVVGIHATYLYGFPQYKAYVFKKNAEELERMVYPTSKRLESFNAKVIKQMKTDEVPIDYKKLDKHLFVEMDGNGIMHAKVIWGVHVDYYGYFPKDFKFEVNIQK